MLAGRMARFVEIPDPVAGGRGRVRIARRAAAEADSAPPLIIIGGLTQTLASWGDHARALAQRREVVVYETRGQGATELGLEVVEEPIPRELLYVADEVFFCGTAAEITPIRSVDRIAVGDGRRGPVTTRLMTAFFDIVESRVPDRHGWLTPVNP